MKKNITARKRKDAGRKLKNRRQPWILVCAAMVTTICAIAFAVRVIPHEADLAVYRREMAALPQLPRTPTIVWETLDFYETRMRGINPDYVGLIMIDGSVMNYPVVRGRDNYKYLNTSIYGAENRFGAIFMDYRCAGENVPHIIIYGHNAEANGHGYMFNGLHRFLDERYRAENPVIRFIENDRISEFEIFSARITDTDDPAYQLDFSAQDSFGAFLERNGAPPDAVQILTLSTCYLEGGDDGRMIIQGMRKRVLPVDKTHMIAEHISNNS